MKGFDNMLITHLFKENKDSGIIDVASSQGRLTIIVYRDGEIEIQRWAHGKNKKTVWVQ